MKVRRYFIAMIGLFLSTPVQAEESEAYPQVLDMPAYIYEDYLVAYDRVFTEEAVPYWWAVGLSTAALIAVDDKLINEAQYLAKKNGISTDDNTKTMVSYKGLPLFRGPTDLGSFLYFIGDGWTHAGIAGGFLATGWATDNDKTFNVGFELVEGMITTTIATQTLKHITGRESPSRATTPTGRWDFFPDQVKYHNNIPAYDAYPSGHVAVASMTLTVLKKNYPDNPWIMPTGVTLISLLSLQMMNNGAHWASDYPLAIALGYTFGTIAYERGERAMAESGRLPEALNDLTVLPLINEQEVGVAINYAF